MNISIIIYFIILLIFFLTRLMYINKNNLYDESKNKRSDKRDKLFLKLSFLVLFVVLIIREPFNDLVIYVKYFNLFNKLSIDKVFYYYDLELFYKLLNLLIGKIWLNDRFFIFILDVITCIGPYYIIKKNSNNYLLSVLLFLSIGTYSMQFYIIRQSLAITFLLFSLKYVVEEKFIRFALLVLIATLFHKSSVIFLIIYPLSKLNIKFLMLFFITSCVILIIFRSQVYNLINFTFYSSYIGGDHDVVGNGYWKLLLYFLLFIFIFLFKKKDFFSGYNNILFVLTIMCILFQVLSTQISLATRLGNDFSISFVLLAPNIISNLNKQNKSIFTILVLIIVFVYLVLINPISGYQIMQ